MDKNLCPPSKVESTFHHDDMKTTTVTTNNQPSNCGISHWKTTRKQQNVQKGTMCNTLTVDNKTTTGEFQDTTISNQSINKKHIQYNNDTMRRHINLCCATTCRRRNSFNISALMMVLLLLLAYCFFCQRPNRSPCRICYFWYIFLCSDHVDLSERGGLRIFFASRCFAWLRDCHLYLNLFISHRHRSRCPMKKG